MYSTLIAERDGYGLKIDQLSEQIGKCADSGNALDCCRLGFELFGAVAQYNVREQRIAGHNDHPLRIEYRQRLVKYDQAMNSWLSQKRAADDYLEAGHYIDPKSTMVEVGGQEFNCQTAPGPCLCYANVDIGRKKCECQRSVAYDGNYVDTGKPSDTCATTGFPCIPYDIRGDCVYNNYHRNNRLTYSRHQSWYNDRIAQLNAAKPVRPNPPVIIANVIPQNANVICQECKNIVQTIGSQNVQQVDLNQQMTCIATIQATEQEAREKAEQEAREKAEQEAREKAEQEAREKAEQEAREKAEQEAREQEAREQEASKQESRTKLILISVILVLLLFGISVFAFAKSRR